MLLFNLVKTKIRLAKEMQNVVCARCKRTASYV